MGAIHMKPASRRTRISEFTFAAWSAYIVGVASMGFALWIGLSFPPEYTTGNVALMFLGTLSICVNMAFREMGRFARQTNAALEEQAERISKLEEQVAALTGTRSAPPASGSPA